MHTYAVREAHLQALLTSIADESEMMFLAPVAVSPWKGPPRPTVSDVGAQKKKHTVSSGNRTYIFL